MNLRCDLFCVCVLILGVLSFVGCGDDKTSFDCAEEGQDYYSAETRIGDLYDFCFDGTAECRNSRLDLLLYLDTAALSRLSGTNSWLYLYSVPGTGGQADVLSVAYDDTMPVAIYEQMVDQQGWKLSITDAHIEFCENCNTNCGLAKIIELVGPYASMEFVYDPEDSLEIYIDHIPTKLGSGKFDSKYRLPPQIWTFSPARHLVDP